MFIGHKKQINFLEDLLGKNKISQSYLFSGPESIGKFSLAKLFAQAIVSENKNLSLDSNLYAENKNPDIEILVPEIVEKKGIIKIKSFEVDRVRLAQKNLSLYPANGKWRVLVINDAHLLNLASQNTLLKTLEEPNSASIIILVTHEDGKILKTVKSRCQKINFNLVSLEEIKNGFKNKLASELLEKITIFSMGKPGEVQKMIKDKDKLISRELSIADLNGLRNMPVFKKFDLAQEYSKNVMETTKRLEFWIWMLRVHIFKNLDNEVGIVKKYQAINKIREVLIKIKNPSFNVRLILENLFLNL